MSPGRLIRETRRRHGLSQAQLAFRAGTRQPAISRLEKDEVSPSVETLESLLRVMGERLDLAPSPAVRSYDPLHRQAMADLAPEERLALAISWNRLAGQLRDAGRAAKVKS